VGSPAVCKAHSEIQSMHLLGVLQVCPPRKMNALRLDLVLFEVQICYAKDRLWKSARREISLAVHATFVF